MELKKSKEADLENKRYVFTALGLLMVSAVVFMAFTTVSAVIDDEIVANAEERVSDEMVFDIEQVEEEPPPVEDVPPPPVIDLEEIEIKDDDEVIKELDLNDLDSEKEPPPKEEVVKVEEEKIADFAEVEPEFPGGEAAMKKFIQENVIYPELSREMGEQGTVYVQFVVNSNGSIEQVVVVKSVSDLLDKEAIRVVKKMPAWKPGEQAGKKVRVRYTVPINFRIV